MEVSNPRDDRAERNRGSAEVPLRTVIPRVGNFHLEQNTILDSFSCTTIPKIWFISRFCVFFSLGENTWVRCNFITQAKSVAISVWCARILMLWMKGPLFCRQGGGFIAQVSMGLLDLKEYMPCEFLRKGRPLGEVDRWKATEFRQFLLYLGPVLLKSKLPLHLYKHSMLLSVAIYCLASPMFCNPYCDYAKQLLCVIVTQVGVLYGQTQYVYNIHALVHLADDVFRFGPLDGFSSFAFESFLGKLKKRVRKPNFPLQQVIRRLSEDCLKECTSDCEPGCSTVKKEHHGGPLPREYATYLQFEQLCLPKSFRLSLKQGNNCILARGKVGIIRNILSPSEKSNERILIVENFRNLENFYTVPLPSSDLRIFQVCHLSGDMIAVNMEEVNCKCVLLPYRDGFVSVPLIHSFV